MSEFRIISLISVCKVQRKAHAHRFVSVLEPLLELLRSLLGAEERAVVLPGVGFAPCGGFNVREKESVLITSDIS
jgi:hypothetical protein